MRRSVLLVALLVVGCNGDPATSRFSVGQLVVPNKSADIEGLDGHKFAEGSPAAKWPMLMDGDQVKVISDSAPDDKDQWGGRYVQIQIVHTRIGSELVGLKCRAKREQLRPTP